MKIDSSAIVVNDTHSALNETVVSRVAVPWSESHLIQIVRRAIKQKKSVAVSGGRHAMGGQQFCSGEILLDLRLLARVRRFDVYAGTIEVEAGIMWPELMRILDELQAGCPRPWVIRQKQTGADRLTLGGAVAANIHGRGLRMEPFISDIESLRVLCADGEARTCSRTQNAELFRLVVGGYGLFGIVTRVKLRLMRRQVMRREVRVMEREGLLDAFDAAIAAGAIYGDFQFSCDEKSSDLLNRGVFSCYFPSPEAAAPAAEQVFLTPDNWSNLLFLAHTDKARAFEEYAGHYLKTCGQLYLSDRMQLATYLDSYHKEIDRRCGAHCPGTEMITEVSVPRTSLAEFLSDAAEYIRSSGANLIYGTVRLIEKDNETFLPWAKENYACVIFNLHVDHTPEGRASAADHFRALIGLGVRLGGSFYLTYHTFAAREQLLAVYPQLPEFLAEKKRFDPEETFRSDWYLRYREMFAPEVRRLEGEPGERAQMRK